MSNEHNDLEELMNMMSATDEASTEVAKDDDMDIDIMPDLCDIDEDVEELESNVQDEEETDAVTDYKKIRAQLNWALQANQKMIVNNARICKVTTHPKNFEAHDKLMQTHVKLCQALLDSSGKVDESKVKARHTRTTKVVPEPEEYENDGSGNVYEGEVVKGSSGEPVRISRKPTSEALFEIVDSKREIEKETGKTLSNEDIVKLALALDDEKKDVDVEDVPQEPTLFDDEE